MTSGTLGESLSGPRAWWAAVTRERWVVMVTMALLIVLATMAWVARRAQLDLVETTAVQEAEQYSRALASFRALYTSEVAAPLGAHGIDVTHDYASREGAIPLPATLTMLLGERIASDGHGGYFRLYSDYPFPWRGDGGPRDDFEWEALRRLKQNPEQAFYEYGEQDGHLMLRYTTADLMQENCVACHNSHPQSPKRDWKVGDLRGVLEVALPLDAAMAQANQSLAGVFALLMVLGASSVGTIFYTVVRLRHQVREALRGVERLGRYSLEQKIGEGGMGQVYRARHAMLRRPTAVKVLRTDRISRESVERFKREVQLTSQLTHPNTIAIYDYGATAAGDFYYAMEYLEGMALDRLASEHAPIGEARVVHILRQVLDSLAEAHTIGLVHRDIKPANIMLCRRGGISDVVKVLDFGLVKQTGLEGNTQLTDMQTLTGTPQFLSPEAIDSPGAVDALSDLYQVAAVGYLLLTGHYVFEGDSVVEVCYQHVSTPPVPPSERLGAPVSKDLEDLILQALSKSKEERPRSARAMSEALGRCAIEGHWTRADADAWWTLTRPIRADEPGETEPTATRVRVGDLDLRLGGTR